MKKLLTAICLVLLLAPAALAQEVIKMSTTTSTQDSGLLEVLLPEFTKDTGIEVQVLAKGTGAAIRDGADGNVDVIFVHDPEREEQFVADGLGTERYKVMHNDFVIVGDPSDPAKIKGLKSALEAFKAIAASKSEFISRGDDSGTHAKEVAVWKATGLPMKDKSPEGEWYLSIGQGMGKTLIMAAEKKAYALTDRGTYIAQKYGAQTPTSLEILVEGDEILFNPYGVIPVNPAKHPHVKHEAAKKFAGWLVSEKGQKTIANYQLSGRQVFYPDAIPDAK
ncbi:MAG: extracellular solute-binding protein [Deltaproteobacteria bacterium]|jgi:tungstate transport system substrate-binding protein|nr:extracellular solute-binding protein [Deltaproteobacteria bacterium]